MTSASDKYSWKVGMRRRKQECREATGQSDHELGFSLLEMLVVLAIMALVAALVAPRLFNQVDKSKLTVANTQINSIATALDTMRLDIGRYPTESEGLALLVEAPSNEISGWFGPYLEGNVPADPWGSRKVIRPASQPGPMCTASEPMEKKAAADLIRTSVASRQPTNLKIRPLYGILCVMPLVKE